MLRDIAQIIVSVLALAGGVVLVILAHGNEAMLVLGGSMIGAPISYWFALPQNPPTFTPSP